MKKGLFKKKARFYELFLSKFPFTYNGILKRTVGKNFQTILDVGCGTGLPMELINYDSTLQATGVDIYSPYLKECRSKNIYRTLIEKDIRKMTFKDRSFDVVVSFHVIEHLTKRDGKKLLEKLEKIAKKRVVVATPVGYLYQEGYDGNEHQEHKSAWYPKDFRALGYKVIGQGLRAIYGGENVVQKYGVFSNVIFFISLLFQPLLFYKPELAVYMFCIKENE